MLKGNATTMLTNTVMNAVGLNEFGGSEVLHPIKVKKPQLKKDEALIRVQGVSVNYADILTRRGSFHSSESVFPIIPGLDSMGIIEAVGENASDLKVGQRVIAFPKAGTYSDYVAANHNLIFIVPDEISDEQATACPLVAFTSHMILNKVAKLLEGETILIHAASGGVGTSAVQIAKSMKAALIIATVRNDNEVNKVIELGADFVICNNKENFVNRVNEITNGKGVDVILDSLGASYTELGMGCLGIFGRVVVYGDLEGSYSQIKTSLLHSSCRSILGFSSVTTRKTKPEWYSETAIKVFQLMISGELKIKISQVLDISEASKAHQLIEDGGVSGKILLRV